MSKLLTEKDFRALLGGMSERKFHQLRAEGTVPLPLELGPRALRWTQADFEETVIKLPRKAPAQEPQHLANGRRERIDAMKRGGL